MIGKKFGKLTVINKDTNKKGYVICKCDCGNIKSIRVTSLTKKKKPTTSCGCKQKQKAKVIGSKTIAKNSKEQISKNVEYNTNIQVIKTKTPPKNNISGQKGVCWSKEKQSWFAYLQIHHKRICLGYFKDKDEAIKTRKEAEEKYYTPILEKALTLKK